MKTIAEIRLKNLEALIEEFGTQDKIAEETGVSPVYLSQLKNGTPDAKTGRPRQMGDRTARKLELGCKKPVGWMDVERYPTAEQNAKPPAIASDVITMPVRTTTYDIWTMAAIELLQSLDIGQRQAMLARMKEYKQYLDPPRIGQAL